MLPAVAKAAPDRAATIVAALMAVALVLLLVAPRASPLVLALIALGVGMAAGGMTLWPKLRDMPIALALVLGLVAWSALSTLWAADRTEAIGKAAILLAFTLVVWCTQAALSQAKPERLRQAGWAALIAFGAGIAYLCFEELSGHGIKRLLFVALPFIRPSAKHIGGNEADLWVSGYISNRNMAVAALTLWPTLLLVQGLVERSRRLPAVAALLTLAVATLALSKHETSIIALAASAALFALASRQPKLALGLVAAGWLVATLLVVPIATWASNTAQLHSASWLPNSARHRIVLWAYTAEQVGQRPLIGVGAASTKLLDARRGSAVDTLPGTGYQWRSGPHAHNVYLQTWYELGAVGALLLSAAGLALIAAVARLSPLVLPYAAAATVSAAVIGAFAWGLWQEWFLAAFAVCAVLTMVAARVRCQNLAEVRIPSINPVPAPSS